MIVVGYPSFGKLELEVGRLEKLKVAVLDELELAWDFVIVFSCCLRPSRRVIRKILKPP